MSYRILVIALLVWQSTSAVAQEAASNATVWAFNLHDGRSRELFSIPGIVDVSSLAVSPDEQSFLYSGIRDGTDSKVVHLWSCKADGTDHRDLGHGTMPWWSPGGNRIVFARESAEPGVWMMRSDGSDPQIIDRFGSNPQWSLDGLSIAYARRKAATADSLRFMVYHVAEQTFEELAVDAGANTETQGRRIAWSPDLQRISMSETNAGGEGQIRIVQFKNDPPAQQVIHLNANSVNDLLWLSEQRLLISSQKKEQATWQLLTITTADEKDRPTRIPGQPSDRSQTIASRSRDGQTVYCISRSVP